MNWSGLKYGLTHTAEFSSTQRSSAQFSSVWTELKLRSPEPEKRSSTSLANLATPELGRSNLRHAWAPSTAPSMVTPCQDRAPIPCLETGCPASTLSCAWLAKNDGCGVRFADMFDEMPAGYQELGPSDVSTECPASCGKCTDAGMRAGVAPDHAAWPKSGVLQSPKVLPGSASSKVLAKAIAEAGAKGPIVITDAYGEAFDPEAWTRPALRARCSPAEGAPPPSPPWPTIAWADPGLTGTKWASMRFENGAALGVRSLPDLMEQQDAGTLRGVALFDSMANHTCGPALLSRDGGGGSSSGKGGGPLAAPRYFPRDFEAALGGAHGEGLWRKGGEPWGDPDLFVSKQACRRPRTMPISRPTRRPHDTHDTHHDTHHPARLPVHQMTMLPLCPPLSREPPTRHPRAKLRPPLKAPMPAPSVCAAGHAHARAR